MPTSDGTSLREMLAGNRFYYGAELVTTRGIVGPDAPAPLADLGKTLLDDPRIGWISITDNPGGAPMLPPDWLAGLLAPRRQRIVLHLTCKDMNRNGVEAAAWRYAAEGFPNLLAITGDYPTTGHGGLADPVFDLDSVGLISLLRSMNEGLQIPSRRGGVETLPKTDFFIGCVVSPFKRHERELVPQYFKLLRKLRAGAQWVIPQLGYDMRKFHEVKLFLQARGFGHVPIIGNVYLLTRPVAELFHSGKLAGCVVSDGLVEEARKQAAGPDKGRKFFRELAAKQLAVFKGLGFTAGYLGGIAKAETFFEIIDLAESYGKDDWREFLKEIRGVLLLRARPGDRPEFVGPSQPAVSGVAQVAAAVEAGHAELPPVAVGPLGGFQPRQGALRRAHETLRPLGEEAGAVEPVELFFGEGVEAPGLRLPGLRRLQPARLRLPLPDGQLLEALPQRPLRRFGRGAV
jgi:methylenetetrahydrofolate reductase (NADPH)